MKLNALFGTIGLTWLSVAAGGNAKNYRRVRKARSLYADHQENYSLREGSSSREGSLTRQVNVDGIRKRSSKSCFGKGKGGSTCMPSESPSSSPSESSAPSYKPSVSPSARPSPQPSESPTNSPSLSVAPSLGPTLSTMPSVTPSQFPSSSPSYSPSAHPSASPSMMPSSKPSLSTMPSKTPSSRPSASPTVSAVPSVKPSASPTLSPSTLPSSKPSLSLAPSQSPSKQASETPSLSTAPSVHLFDTDSSDGLVSTCVPTVPSGTRQEQTLAFRYNLFTIPSADTTNAIGTVESSLHSGLAGFFLECGFSNTTSFHIVSIDSKPRDKASAQACDTTSGPIPTEPSVCVVVEAALSMTALFLNTRRLQETVANPEIQNAAAEYLDESMENGDHSGGEVVQVTFLGFVNVQTAGETTAGDGDGIVTGAVGGIFQPDNGGSNLVAGSAIVGMAAIVFVIAAFISFRYRKSRREAYMQHLDDMSVFSGKDVDRTATLDSDGGKVEVVGETSSDEDDVDSLDEIFQVLEEEERAHIDVHQCSSATCKICQYREIRPTFVPTKISHNIIADLSRHYPSPSRPRTIQTPRSPDTVEL